MRVHITKHVPSEGPGLIAEWAASRRCALTESLALTEEYPPLGPGDLLTVMGGPMAADDEIVSPWLAAEKRAVAAALDSGALVLGVCLGAQILAEVVGGTVARNPQREIGWYPVRKTASAVVHPVFSAFPDGLVVGHWHGDTFTLPPGIPPLLSSDATVNQAFGTHEGRAVGLQFHLEWTCEGLSDLADLSADEIAQGGPFVAGAAQMLTAAPRRIPACREALFGILDRMVATGGDA